ncbi:hypothetical protein AB0F81_34705 [Actinoplanes sp. NPDC024001]|uniref:hypothetical protein n=1 Tax=Actinoplanes sp. NPDC024001 TaxID=3154598 RepID=UPI0034032C0C
MTPLDDHSQRQRPLFFPVVIATALLTIIGLAGGYLLGEQSTRAKPQPTPSPSVSLLPTTGRCPEQTQEVGRQQQAVGELREVLRVRTERKTVVWICQDEAGGLYYHANKGGTGAVWVEGKTALFLSQVWREGESRYVAQAYDGNIFSVDRKRLLISYADGSEEVQKVIGD